METNREQTWMLVMSQIIPDKSEIRIRNSFLIQANICDVSFNSGCVSQVSSSGESSKDYQRRSPCQNITEKPSSTSQPPPQPDSDLSSLNLTDRLKLSTSRVNSSDVHNTHSGVSNEHTQHVRVCIYFDDSGSSHNHRSQISSVSNILFTEWLNGPVKGGQRG